MTTGGMEALHLAVLCTVAAGDEVAIPTPAWPNYFVQARLADADPVEIPFLAPETDEASVPLAERLLGRPASSSHREWGSAGRRGLPPAVVRELAGPPGGGVRPAGWGVLTGGSGKANRRHGGEREAACRTPADRFAATVSARREWARLPI